MGLPLWIRVANWRAEIRLEDGQNDLRPNQVTDRHIEAEALVAFASPLYSPGFGWRRVLS